MSRPERNGWLGLVNRVFEGDEDLARQWVADLGRATYYARSRPLVAGRILSKWREYFPLLVKDTPEGPYPLVKSRY